MYITCISRALINSPVAIFVHKYACAFVWVEAHTYELGMLCGVCMFVNSVSEQSS